MNELWSAYRVGDKEYPHCDGNTGYDEDDEAETEYGADEHVAFTRCRHLHRHCVVGDVGCCVQFNQYALGLPQRLRLHAWVNIINDACMFYMKLIHAKTSALFHLYVHTFNLNTSTK